MQATLSDGYLYYHIKWFSTVLDFGINLYMPTTTLINLNFSDFQTPLNNKVDKQSPVMHIYVLINLILICFSLFVKCFIGII